MLSKTDQLHKVKRINLKRMSKIENKLYHDDILDTTGGICQLCNESQGVEFHHAYFGRYGADKDDTKQVLSCRKCHELCHNEKHGVVNTMAKWIADNNWSNYNE